jgi:hypothetical protein
LVEAGFSEEGLSERRCLDFEFVGAGFLGVFDSRFFGSRLGSIVGRVPGISPGGAQIFQVHVKAHGVATHVSESAQASVKSGSRTTPALAA